MAAGLGTDFGAAGLAARRAGFAVFGRLRAAGFAAAGLTLEEAFGFAAALDFTTAARLPVLGAALARLADVAFAFLRRGFGVLAAAFGAFRVAAGFAFDADFRESAGLAAALPRFFGFAMVLASTPPAGGA